MPQALTPQQLRALSDIERACSILSLISCVWTILTFCLSKSFRKPINRLVFYATFGNMLTNVGTLISRHFLDDINSPGCQFQAFLIQMFMPADAFWTFAMALNVYLTFYFKFDAMDLRRLEIWYIIGCYGIPFVPAFVYIFVKNSQGVSVYGNAVLWCWVSNDWDIWRMLTFYVPVWFIMTMNIAIYIRAGRTIYLKRKEFIQFNTSDTDPLSVNGDVLGTLKTTEVTITREPVAEDGVFQSPNLDKPSSTASKFIPANPSYAVHIAAGRRTSSDLTLPIQKPPAPDPQRAASVATVPPAHQFHLSLRRKRHQDLNRAAWAYTKSSLLFFTAILITWIPSGANRLYPVVHHGQISVPLEFMGAFVLPLQGFWNAVIYTAISWTAFKELWTDFRQRHRSLGIELMSDTSHRKGPQDDRKDHWDTRSGVRVPSLGSTEELNGAADLEQGQKRSAKLSHDGL